MTNNIVTKYINIKEPGAIFAEALTTDYVELNNYKYIDITLSTSKGTVAETNIIVLGKLGESGDSQPICFREKLGDGINYLPVDKSGVSFSVGKTDNNKGFAVYRITADDLAKGGYDRVALSISSITDCAVVGSVIGVFYEPRYTE